MSSEISSLKIIGFLNSVYLNTCKFSFYTVLEWPKRKQLDENETKTAIYSKIVSFTNLGILDK
jgi:hypothetical protein